MQVGPSGASFNLVIAPPLMACASERLTSLHGFSGLAPVLLSSSFEEPGVWRAGTTFAPVDLSACTVGCERLGASSSDPAAGRLDCCRAPPISGLLINGVCRA